MNQECLNYSEILWKREENKGKVLVPPHHVLYLFYFKFFRYNCKETNACKLVFYIQKDQVI